MVFNNSILLGAAAAQGGGGFYPQTIEQSLKFNDDESQYLSWTPAAAGNRKTWTYSVWLKRGANITATVQNHALLSNSDGSQGLYLRVNPNDPKIDFACGNGNLVTNALYRDHSAWYHIVAQYDSANSTMKLYVNGEQVTDLATNTQPSLNTDGNVNDGNAHYIGRQGTLSRYLDGYLSDVYFIDGQALDASSFGQFKEGVWVATSYSGTYGTNGFHLTFQDDVVSEGFNTVTYAGTSTNPQSISGLGFAPDLVWLKARNQTYEHILFDTIRGSGKRLFSHLTNAESTNINTLSSFDADGFTVGTTAGADLSVNGSGNSYVAWAWDAGDVTSIVTNGDFSNGTTGWTANNCTASVNSDGRLSATFVSSGAYVYQLLTTVVGQTYAITYNNYQAADFVFVHATSPTGTQIASSDGSGTAPILFTATTTTTSIRFDIPSSQTRIIDDVQVFEANTDGSITSTVKANPDYGFSIVSYTGNGTAGATIGHGLSSAPEMIILKKRTATGNWITYHKDANANAENGYIALNLTSAWATNLASWNNTVPSSSVFTVGSGQDVNLNSAGFIGYCFHSVAGYSSFGSYSGTDSAGVTVTTGFRPAFVMIKATNIAENWVIIDNTRNPANPANSYLEPNTSDAEASSSAFDIEFTDTGFVLNGTDDAINGYSGGTGEYIYMAFADTREAAFWKDVSGNNNNWTPNNLDYRDSLPDSPTNNFATLNPLVSLNAGTSGNGTFSEGNLKCVWSGSLVSGTRLATIGVSSGKWYYEADWEQNGSNDASYGFIGGDGSLDNGRLNISTSGKYMCAVDMDNLLIWFGVDGVWTGDPDAGTGGTSITDVGDRFPFFRDNSGSSGQDWTVIANFGQDSTFAGSEPIGAYADDNGKGLFQYAVPSGFLSLCSDNLPEVTVGPNSAAKPIDQFETILYTGNGGTQHIGSGGVQHPVDVTTIDNSLRFNDSDSAYLSRTPASSGNRKTWTWSGWVKRGNIGTTQDIFIAGSNASGQLSTQFTITSGNILQIYSTISGSAEAILLQTTQVFSDVSAWYHIVLQANTTDVTASNRVKLYVNGEQVTSFSTATYPSQNYDTAINNNVIHTLGRFSVAAANHFDGYLSDIHFIDGQALDPTSFGQYGANGYWIPKTVTGLTYGTNGFLLDFSDNSTATALGTDGSGNGNDWTPANLGVSDQMLDSPTQNYATLDALQTYSTVTLSEGNLKSFSNDAARLAISEVTYGLTSGKYYFEYSQRAGSNVGYPIIFINDSTSADYTDTGYSGYGVNAYGEYILDGTNVARVASLSLNATSDVRMFAIDFDNGKIWAGKNGTWYDQGGTSYTNATGPESGSNEIAAGFDYNLAKIFVGHNDSGSTGMFNFGADSTFAGNKTAASNADDNGYGNFQYAPPSGFLALVNDNIPEERGINSPDFVWIKQRSGTAFHNVYDSLRIVDGDHKRIYTNATNAEESSIYSGTTNLISFDYDGFTVGNGTDTNNSGSTYASWNWKAGGTAVSNTDGSITSQVSANTDAGFSVVSWTGTGANATVGHGLNSAPEMIIPKDRDSGNSWSIYHSAIGAGKYMNLNETISAQTNSAVWQGVEPTSSVFSIGTSGNINQSGDDFIAYCFHSVDGFSKVGSYTGNSSSDGTFVYTGFRPAWILYKRTNDTGQWVIRDNKRDVDNPTEGRILANASDAENVPAGDKLDFLSNGFKLRSNSFEMNNSSSTYIYLAFAENPFKYANAR